MELVVASWFTRKWLKLYQTKRNLTSGNHVCDNSTGSNLIEKRPGSWCIFDTCLREEGRRCSVI